MLDIPMHLWPVATIQDRYDGTYSGGPWLAMASFGIDKFEILADGPLGSDPEAMNFWLEPPLWITVGDSPDDAITKLLVRFKDVGPSMLRLRKET